MPTYQYCEREDIEALFGTENPKQWANIDNLDPTSEAGLAHIAARIDKACDRGTLAVDRRMRGGPYSIPIQKQNITPDEVVDLAATFAAKWLYMSRSVEDTSDDETAEPIAGPVQEAEATIAALMARKHQIDADAAGSAVPTAVEVDLTNASDT